MKFLAAIQVKHSTGQFYAHYVWLALPKGPPMLMSDLIIVSPLILPIPWIKKFLRYMWNSAVLIYVRLNFDTTTSKLRRTFQLYNLNVLVKWQKIFGAIKRQSKVNYIIVIYSNKRYQVVAM